jgi:hypothetical protein
MVELECLLVRPTCKPLSGSRWSGMESVAVDITPPLSIQDPRSRLDHRTLPSPAIIGHVLDLFFKHFACRYPFLIRSDLHECSPYFPFLLHSMGSLVAR